MSETYPDDLDLLALGHDEQSGVDYIETGKAPYYLEFRRMLFRILANLAPLGLRVYKTGPLAVRVKPGYYWLGGDLKHFAGSGADLTLTNNDINCVFLADDNTAGVATDGDGWPTAEHVRLAEIATSAGGFNCADIIDLRGQVLASSLAGLTATVEELNDADLSARTQDIAGAGAVDLSARHVRLTGPVSNSYAITLAAPERAGIVKIIEMVATTDANAVTLALDHVVGGSGEQEASFDEAGEVLVLVSASGVWVVLKEVGVTLY